MIVVYGIKNCATIKKTQEALQRLCVDYHFFDYKKQKLDRAVLVSFIDQQGLALILNKKGSTWRKLSEADKQRCDEDGEFAIDVMLANPSMIKRPIITKIDVVVAVGFDEQAFGQLANNLGN